MPRADDSASLARKGQWGRPNLPFRVTGRHILEFQGIIEFVSVGGGMASKGFIKGDSLREMLGVGALVNVTIAAQHDAFVVLVGSGLTQRALQAKRGHLRRFRTLDSAAQFLNKLGCRHAALDMERWAPEQRSLP